MASKYDLALSYGLETSQEEESGFELNDLYEAPIAVIGDIAKSIANTFLFEDSELETSDVLNYFGAEGAASFYEEHRDGVELASFVGGVFLPGSVAAWGIRTARAAKGGMFANSRFNVPARLNDKITANKEEALRLIKADELHTDAYRAAMKGQRTWSMVEGVAEAVIYETAIAGMFQGHSYMENYDASDFAIGAALGGIFAPINWLVRKNQYSLEAKQVEEWIQAKTTPTTPVSLTAAGHTNGQKLATYQSLLKSQLNALDSLSEDSAKAIANQLDAQVLKTKNLMEDVVHNMSTKELQDTFEALPKGKNDKVIQIADSQRGSGEANPIEMVMQILTKDPQALNGAESLGIFGLDSAAGINTIAKAVKDKSTGVTHLKINDAEDFLSTLVKPTDEVAIMPESIRILDLDGIKTIEVPSFSVLGDASSPELAWLHSNLVGNVDIVAADGKAITRKARLQLEARAKSADQGNAEKLRQLRDWAIKPEDFNTMLTLAKPTAVITNYFGKPKIIGSIEAKVLQGIADNPGWAPNARYKIFENDSSYNPTKFSIYRNDEAFANAAVAESKLTKGFPELRVADENLPDLQAALTYVNRFSKELDDPIKVMFEGKAYFGAEQLESAIKAKKADTIKQMVREGFSPEQAAKATNTPLATVLKSVENGHEVVPDLNYIVYNSADLTTHLKPSMVEIRGAGLTAARQEEMANVHLLDADQMQNLNKVLQENDTLTHGTEHMQSQTRATSGGDMAMIEANLDVITASQTGSKGVYTATDFALRNLGDIGRMVTTMAQKFDELVRNRASAVKDAVRPLFQEISANPVARTQFYQVRNALEAIDGEAGKLLKYDQTLRKIITQPAKGDTPAKYLKYSEGGEDIVLQRENAEFFADWTRPGGMQAEFLADINLQKKLQGKDVTTGRGIWLPDSQIDDGLVAYVINTANAKDLQRITGRTAEDLATNIADFEKSNHNPNMKVITNKSNLDEWNDHHGYARTEHVRRADSQKSKGGFANTDVPVDASGLDNIMAALEKETWKNKRAVFKLTNSKVFDALESNIAHSRRYNSEGSKSLRDNTAELVYKTLLGVSKIEDAPLFESANNFFTAGMNKAIRAVDGAKTTFAKQVGSGEYTDLVAKLEADGVPMPWKDFDSYMVKKNKHIEAGAAQNLIARNSAVLVALNLRLFEVSHAAVTIMSLPVILGAELKSQQYPLKSMIDGIKLMMGKDEASMAIMKKASDLKYTKRVTSEVTDIIESTHTKTGFISKLEAKDKFGKHKNDTAFAKVWNTLTKPSDWAEHSVREMSYATGYRMAQSKFPDGADEVLEAFANAFTLRTMGNYNARQRPALFQGALGATVGLYQTFMLTMAQNMARYVERGDKKALGLLLGGQASMFGVESLPGFDLFNDILGEYVGDPNSHQDIRQTLYKALGDDSDQSRSAAEYALFGFPSTLFQTAVQTRGDLQVRSPITLKGDGFQFAPPVFNAYKDGIAFAWNTMSGMANAFSTAGGKDVFRAFGEGVASQSLWRPAARLTELGLGYSLDRSGQQVSNESEVGGWATMSRVMGSRPMKEQSLRTLKYSGKYYDAIDSGNRRDAINTLRTITRGESDGEIGGVMQKYLDAGGTARGWNTALNTAYAGLDNTFADRLLGNATKQEGIADIINTYEY